MNITFETLRLYWQHAWRYPRHLIVVLLTIPTVVLIQSYLPPLIVAGVLNRLAHHDYQAHNVWANFGGDLIAYAALVLFGTFLWRLVDHHDWRLEAGVEKDIAQEVYGHLIDQSADFHANHFTGSLVSQTNKLLGSYIRFADTTAFQVIPLLASLVFAGIILARAAPLFVVLLLSFSFFYIVSAFFISRRVRTLSAEHANAESAQTGYLADSVTNVMAIKSFSRDAFENRQYARTTEYTRDRLLDFAHANQVRSSYFSALLSSISVLAFTMSVIGAVILHANLATVFLIINYTSNIIGQLFSFSNNALRNYNRSFGDAADMVKILHHESAVKDPAQPEHLRIKNGEIEFRGVSFTHNGTDDALFSNLSLRIRAGEKVGLVGHSGSGKSTFIRILLRFSDIDDGEILIDGQNIAKITQNDLRSTIAYVPQEPLLFHRTIKENIAYGKPDASDHEVRTASIKANADEFIRELPQGYDTLVGERGVKLSGGQRQRVAIARAILKEAPILVLDEATSSLDSASEQLIQAALKELMVKRSAIVVAHRLSTIQKMDRIIVLDNGKIVEDGTHSDLLKQKGTYAQLWAHQSGGFIEE
ncbi:MAG TPA: ABC transporter ATP-binding protein [Candidatus Saccharimonadales bacterium]|nr:ABC transporter ATP-binding protein [Candidatus Saccharimonadales bacterium]